MRGSVYFKIYSIGHLLDQPSELSRFLLTYFHTICGRSLLACLPLFFLFYHVLVVGRLSVMPQQPATLLPLNFYMVVRRSAQAPDLHGHNACLPTLGKIYCSASHMSCRTSIPHNPFYPAEINFRVTIVLLRILCKFSGFLFCLDFLRKYNSYNSILETGSLQDPKGRLERPLTSYLYPSFFPDTCLSNQYGIISSNS